jgi:hypothetical protein
MPIKPEDLATLMHEVEQEDPIDFADLPFPEDELRQLVASHLCEMAASMENFSTEDKLMTLLAVSAKLVLENMVSSCCAATVCRSAKTSMHCSAA